jgi:uncharacterized membrane protein YphA (DoxX/SURF4 family)
MKTTKIIYWVSTSIVGLMMLFSAYAYFTNPDVQAGFTKMGFHNFFRIELGIAKLIGAIVLLTPIAARIKEWAYAGFTITFISAFIAHTSMGDPLANAITPLVILAILIVSYISYHKLQAGPEK